MFSLVAAAMILKVCAREQSLSLLKFQWKLVKAI